MIKAPSTHKKKAIHFLLPPLFHLYNTLIYPNPSMTDFTLVAPEPLRFSNSPAESLCHVVECQLSPRDDDLSHRHSTWAAVSEYDEQVW